MNYVFLILCALLFITWLVAVTLFHVVGGLIHLLLIMAVVFLLLHFVQGRRAV